MEYSFPHNSLCILCSSVHFIFVGFRNWGKIWSTLESLNGGVADRKSFITAIKHPDPALGNEAVTMSEITGALDQNANKTSGIVSSLKEVSMFAPSQLHFAQGPVFKILYSLVAGIRKNMSYRG